MKNSLLLKILTLIFALTASPAAGAGPASDKKTAGRLPEIRIGLSAHDVGGLWSGTSKEDGLDINAEAILKQGRFSFLKGDVSPNIGFSANTGGDTSSLYAGLIWERRLGTAFFLNLGVGAALHNGELETADADRKQLGSPVLFRIPVELGYVVSGRHRISFLFVHLSNAYLAHPNEGLDALGIRYGYRF